MEESTVKYRRQDTEGGFLFNKSDIDYYKATQRNDVIDNSLLGDFNMVGTYVVNNAIVEELLKLRKVYTDSYAKSIFCESIKKFNGESIKFRLNILPNTPTVGKVTASLELLEEIIRTNGYYKNTNSVLLESKIFTDIKDISKKILLAFNIIDNKDDDSGAKRENDYEFQNIIRRKASLLDLRKRGTSINAKSEKELFQKRIALFKTNNKCSAILEEFNRQVFHIKDRFLDPNNQQYYRHLNQILDGVFDMYCYIIVDDKKLMASYRKINNMYVERQNKADLVLSSEQIRYQTKQDKKEYEKFVKKSEQEVKEEIKAKQTEAEQTKKEPEINIKKPTEEAVKEVKITETELNKLNGETSTNLNVGDTKKDESSSLNISTTQQATNKKLTAPKKVIESSNLNLGTLKNITENIEELVN